MNFYKVYDLEAFPNSIVLRTKAIVIVSAKIDQF